MTKLWSTQGGWISARLPALKIRDICTDIAQTANEQRVNETNKMFKMFKQTTHLMG